MFMFTRICCLLQRIDITRPYSSWRFLCNQRLHKLWWLKPRLHSRGFRAGCTRLDDPCTTGSTTLPRPGTSVPGRERPWATAWRFSTGSEFLSWGKNQSRFFLSGAQTCLFVSWRPWLWHERDKASYNRDRAGEKSVCFWGRLS